MAAVAEDYGAESIVALEGLEAVRKRSAMYIGSTGKQGFHHLLWEVIDNSIDEAMAGHCTKVKVILRKDGSAEVIDNGRGIPIAPQTSGSYKGMPTVEMAMTVLHAGGKFGGGAYSYSGGLHGVGISVVNALSRWATAEITRDGKVHRIEFAYSSQVVDGTEKMVSGAVTSPLTVIGDAPKKASGTKIRFLPDEDVFSTTEWDSDIILNRLRNNAFLNPGIECTLVDKRGDEKETTTFHYPNGLSDFMDVLSTDRLAYSDESDIPHDEDGEPIERKPVLPEYISLSGEEDEVGEWELCLQWYPDRDTAIYSYANGIETADGGTHVDGVTNTITRIMNRYARQEHVGLLGPKDPNLQGRDILTGVGMIMAAKVKEAQFQGQTKGRLGNENVKSMVSSGFSESMWSWMEDHPVETRMIIEKAAEEMRVRNRLDELAEKERQSKEKKGFTPKDVEISSKLNDCETKDRSLAELFITEGDSAAGSAILSRDPETQAILPIRGKVLNVVRADSDRVSANKEVQSLIAALGAGSEDHFDIEQARYNKVVILTDADDDGRHIQLLIMSLFYRLMRPFVEAGRLYVARTPLWGSMHKDQKVFAYTVEERDELDQKYKGLIWTRFKGLGEMDADQLAETSIEPKTRRICQLTVQDMDQVGKAVYDLMGDDTDAKWEVLSTLQVAEEEAISA